MSKNVRLYRFYNLDQAKHGEPFAMCDDHMDAYKKGRKPAAPQLILEKIADQAVWPCDDCERAEAARAERRAERAVQQYKEEEAKKEKERLAREC